MWGVLSLYTPMTDDKLISEIEAFAKVKGIRPATVTSRGVSNSRLYGRLKAGGSCTHRIANRLREYMKENQMRANS